MDKIVDVIIPAFNEEESISLVLRDMPHFVREVIVVNNASTDNTSDVAKNDGATVLLESRKGYGNACLRGVYYLSKKEIQPDIVVFLDADYSDHPEEMGDLIAPIINKDIDLVIGSRALGKKEKGAMMPQQIFGNWLATFLMKRLFDAKFTDLGPFRAIKYHKLQEIEMKDTDFGWTVEMQLKAIKNNLSYTEVPVTYRARIGVSKISGTLKGTIMAGYKILYTIFKYR